ncbi:MAG: carboxypeptidase-like regulatory domain-containing protein [Acidobacteria bacterium]|nr:carboxypeptidase-like regulatory domain-containing protein [Acidobacteriota bacterium]
MKPKSKLLLFFGLLLLVSGSNLSASQKSQRRSVPKDFSYPEASQIVEIDASAKSLSGVVQSPGGDGLPDALVERVDSDWKQRLDATFTDSEGRFALLHVPNGKYYLKISKADFSTLRVKVHLKKRAKSRLELVLPLGI